jgi:hypothetical protein
MTQVVVVVANIAQIVLRVRSVTGNVMTIRIDPGRDIDGGAEPAMVGIVSQLAVEAANLALVATYIDAISMNIAPAIVRRGGGDGTGEHQSQPGKSRKSNQNLRFHDRKSPCFCTARRLRFLIPSSGFSGASCLC